MKLYLDDTRATPSGWIGCMWPSEMIALLSKHEGEVEEISLDHDLGDAFASIKAGRKEITGKDVLAWIMDQVVNSDYSPPIIHIHTANPRESIMMKQTVERIYELADERLED